MTGIKIDRKSIHKHIIVHVPRVATADIEIRGDHYTLTLGRELVPLLLDKEELEVRVHKYFLTACEAAVEAGMSGKQALVALQAKRFEL